VKKRLGDPSAYRSRSAFKLLEIDSQFDNFLLKQDVKSIVDLGAAPGGWSQVVAGKLGWPQGIQKLPTGGLDYGKKSDAAIEALGTWSNPKIKSPAEDFDPLNIDDVQMISSQGRGIIVAVDLLRIQPIHGVHTLRADFLAPETEAAIHGLLSVKGNPEGKADIVLSDMAANSSGNVTHDIESSLEICEAVFEFVVQNLRTAESIGRRRGGVLLMKHFTHPRLHRFRQEKLEPNFHDVKYVKPNSSRTESKETYFLCQGWKGLT